jgi:hypothetical protein
MRTKTFQHPISNSFFTALLHTLDKSPQLSGMDPLSILASVTGLLLAAGTVSSTLVTIRSILKDVPQSVNQIASEINDLTGSFSAVQKFLLGLASAPRRRIALIQLDQLVATLTEAVLAFSELEALVAPFTAKPTIATVDRVKWSLKESEITPILHRLQRHKSSLSLMLNIVQWYIPAFCQRL